LEIYDTRNKTWFSPEERPGIHRYSRAAVLIGESLSQLSNDTFVPTLHRVVRASWPCLSSVARESFFIFSQKQLKEDSRFSVPFFLSARRGALLDPRVPSALADPCIRAPFGHRLLVHSDTAGGDKDGVQAKANLLEVGSFLWEQTKRASAAPATVASTLHRLESSEKNRK